MTPVTRRRFLAAVSVAALAGCSGEANTGERGEATPTSSSTTERNENGSAGGSFSNPVADEQLPLSMSPERIRDNAMSGGPSKDGIPSVDNPQFVDPGDADFLDPGDPVFGVVRDGVAKAYPQKILVQHEIANDELAGEPVSVTYCPLTGTVQGFERGDTTFGVSGRLINNNLVMYDRATEAWWPQILATSIPGPWNENPPIRSLREFRLIWTTWKRWRNENPETEVMSMETGFARNYNNDPYGAYNPRGGYYETDRLLFPALHGDDRFRKKRVVMGARTSGGAAAFLKDAIRKKHVMTGDIGDQPIVAVYDDRYDTAYVYRNPDETSVEFDGGEVIGPDGESHLPDELPLEHIHTFDAMWFAWAGYYPDTNVYE